MMALFADRYKPVAITCSIVSVASKLAICGVFFRLTQMYASHAKPRVSWLGSASPVFPSNENVFDEKAYSDCLWRGNCSVGGGVSVPSEGGGDPRKGAGCGVKYEGGRKRGWWF